MKSSPWHPRQAASEARKVCPRNGEVAADIFGTRWQPTQSTFVTNITLGRFGTPRAPIPM